MAEKLQSIGRKQERSTRKIALSLRQLQQRIQHEAELAVSLEDRVRPTAKVQLSLLRLQDEASLERARPRTSYTSWQSGLRGGHTQDRSLAVLLNSFQSKFHLFDVSLFELTDNESR